MLALILLLAASYAVRVVLVRQGGQFFWLDESHRFSPCIRFVDAIRSHGPDWREAGDILARHQHHFGFFAVGIPVAVLYQQIGRYLRIDGLWIPAAVLALASVAAIGLTFAIARRSGGTPEEALCAAFLMGCANSMFYSTRHILPYETGLAASLGVLWLSLGERRSFGWSFMLGALGSIAYLVYYGYLSLALVVLALYVLRQRRISSAIAVVAGFATPPLLVHAFTLVWAIFFPTRWALPFLVGVWRLMHGATQGGFAEGWRVPWEVLWHAEHGLLLVWILGTAGACWLLWRGAASPRQRLWLLALALLYGQMVVESTVLHLAVVEGRFVRQLVPFLCLVTAATLCHLATMRSLPRGAWAAFVAVCIGQTAVNFAQPLQMRFPADVQRQTVQQYGADVSFALSVVGPPGWPDRGRTRYVLLNTVVFPYPAKASLPPPVGRVLVRYPHPLEFLPYQYEVFDGPGRSVLRSTDISMRVIDTWDGGPPAPADASEMLRTQPRS